MPKEQTISVGKVVEYKKNKYRVKEFVLLKHPDSGEWLQAVLYRQFGGQGLMFVREKKDFIMKFTLEILTGI